MANKSQAIRDYVASVPPSKRGPSAVVEALKSKGIEVSSQLVSQVANRMKKKTRKAMKKSTKVAKAKAKRTKSAIKAGKEMETWIIAKTLLNSVGGDLAAAKKNLELVARLLS